MGDASRHVRADLDELRAAAERRRDELVAKLHDIVDEHPFVAVAAAFGAGYALSGALVSRFTMRLLSLGGRLYFGRLVEERLGSRFAGDGHA
jgi:hypothetical protein